jgi:hypothetical protein
MKRISTCRERSQTISSPGNSSVQIPSLRSPYFQTSNAVKYLFINSDLDDPNRRAKKAPTDNQKAVQEQMVEIGGACIWCSEKRKVCDLDSTCKPCQAAGIGCVRGIGEFNLFRKPDIRSANKGAYKEALEKAKKDTSKHMCSILRELPGIAHPPIDAMSKIILQVATNPNSLDASKPLEIVYADLFDRSHTNREGFTDRLIQTLQGFVNVAEPEDFDRIDGKESFGERKLLRVAETASVCLSLLEGLQHAKVYASAGEQSISILLGGLIYASLVQRLGFTADMLCERLRERLRHKKGHYAETRYAIALYYVIITRLMDLKSDSAMDSMLDALRTRLPVVRAVVQSLFEKSQETLKNEKKKMLAALKGRQEGDMKDLESGVNNQFQGMLDVDQSLETFVLIHSVDIPRPRPLHFAFYIAHEDGLPVSSRAIRQFNSFDHRNPLKLAQLLRKTIIDPELLSHSSPNSASVVSSLPQCRPLLPKIETTFFPGPSGAPFLTESNVNNLSADVKPRFDLLSPSTARHACHASLRTSQAGTAVSSVAETETTFAVSPRVFDEPDSVKVEPLTVAERKLDFDSLNMTQEKPVDHSKISIGVKRPRPSDMDGSPDSPTLLSKRVEIDPVADIARFHELEWEEEWDHFFGPTDSSAGDARNRETPWSLILTSHAVQ